ncbi:hypothetical protein D8770_23175 [Methylobacterium sp. DB1607]|jgi:hypothetical protein|nr:hypothetical protein [Methylobacterium sp. DB1607]
MASPPAPGATGFCRLHLAAIAAKGNYPFPIWPGTKKTDWNDWPVWCRRPPQPNQIARWRERHGHYGLAIATGYACIAIENDEEGPHRSASEFET